MKHDKEWYLDRTLNLVGSFIGAAAAGAVAIYAYMKSDRH